MHTKQFNYLVSRTCDLGDMKCPKNNFPPKIIIKLDNIIKNNRFRTLQIDQTANREMPMNEELLASKKEWWKSEAFLSGVVPIP